MCHKSSTQIRPVGLLRRLGALVYDGLLLFAMLVFASLIVIVPFKITYGHPLYAVYVIYIYTIAFLFFGWFWTHSGQTLGMKTWQIYVSGDDGNALAWKQAVSRFLSALIFWLPAAAGYCLFRDYFKEYGLITLLPITVDYLWGLIDKDQRALHDIISHTRLVRREGHS
jgi:uncharacterized RDD family membrane protein YckC